MSRLAIEHGLLPGQVLQRNAKGFASATVRGTTDPGAEGEVVLRVETEGKAVRGFARVKAGRAAKGRWTASLENLPAGGPYDARFSVGTGAEARVANLWVGDVWLLGGQSNMQGVGNVIDALPPHPRVHAFYTHDVWGVAEEPVTFYAGAVDPVFNPEPETRPRTIDRMKKSLLKGVGPALAFGRAMERRTGVPQGLVCCAKGGTSMEQWSPKHKKEGGRSLYGAMLRRVRKLGQPVAGMLWYQGCSDNGDPRPYTRRMKAFVKAVRKDLAQPDLPWVAVQIGRFFPLGDNVCMPGWTAIREHQRVLPDRIDHLSLVSAIDLPMEDGIHVSALGHRILGERLARAACFRLGLDPAARDGIRLRGIRKISWRWNRGAPAVEVAFENVVGGLRAEGEPMGFRLIAPDGTPSHRIHKTLLKGDKAILEAYIDGNPSMKGYRLAYGFEADAACNLRDAEGMGVPAFGPQPIR